VVAKDLPNIEGVEVQLVVAVGDDPGRDVRNVVSLRRPIALLVCDLSGSFQEIRNPADPALGSARSSGSRSAGKRY